MTTSEDGHVKWWDLRNLEQPTLQWRLQDINRQDGQVCSVSPVNIWVCDCHLVRTVELDHSPTMLEYEGTIPSRYMVGTSQGRILCCSRKAKSQKEIILSQYGAHYSSVRAVQRNTIFPKSFLSAGDWSIKVHGCIFCQEILILSRSLAGEFLSYLGSGPK